MNKKGICLYFGYSLKIGEEQRLIKKHKFDCIMTSAEKILNFENGCIRKQVRLCKKYGLELSSLHMSYFTKNLYNFWIDCKEGNEIEKSMIRDVKIAHKYGFTCVVVHLKGEPTNIGFDRLRRVLKHCEKYKMPLALENIGFTNTLRKTFDTIKSDYLKFCFDIGHQNVYDKGYDCLKEFGDKLITLHLHSNMGQRDEHTLKKYGNIDWDNFAKRLAKINPNINLDYEILMHTRHCEKAEEVLDEVYKEACELEAMIGKYKN